MLTVPAVKLLVNETLSALDVMPSNFDLSLADIKPLILVVALE